MTKSNLPTYAIVELIIRLSKHIDSIGHYQDHAVYDNEVIVKTSAGTIVFPQILIIKQFQSPEMITDDELIAIGTGFRPRV